MSAEKAKALVLKSIPYQESSCILYLFSENHGLIHGIAKGIRRNTKERVCVERGLLIEAVVYIKPHRDLHTLGSIHVLEFYPSVRCDIIKSALRDAAFETILAAITASDFHPELFTFFVKFMQHVDLASEAECYPCSLWLFYHRFCFHLGFGMDMEHCISCGSSLTGDAFMAASKGGLECGECGRHKHESQRIPAEVRLYLHHGSPKPQEIREIVLPAVSKNITRLLSDYCRYHFDIRKEFKTLAFLDTMAEW